MLIGTFALFADQRRAHFAAIPPVPTHGRQVIAAGRPEADRTIFALGKAALPHAPLKQRVFFT